MLANLKQYKFVAYSTQGVMMAVADCKRRCQNNDPVIVLAYHQAISF